MSRTHPWTWAVVVCLFAVPMVCAQSQPASDVSSGSAGVAAVPRLVKFSGGVLDKRGEPLGSVAVRLTFSVYEEPAGGAALWVESQVAQLDEQGHYTVLLGATRADGLPVELFPAGKARWLGVVVEGRDEEPRVLLVSVPYALKAEDAAMLGGRSAADFVLAEQLKDEVRTQVEAQKPATTSSVEMLIPGQPIRPAFTAGPTTITCTTGGDCVAVTQSGAGRALSAAATSSTEAVLVQQSGTGYGLRALTPSTTSPAVWGKNTATSGYSAQGVYGETSSTEGIGVAGWASATSGDVSGVRGDTASTNGKGVYGYASATSGFANGVFGMTSSTGGNGVSGLAAATSGWANGVSGSTNSPDASGVYGVANATSGIATGVWGASNSASGAGVFGLANNAGGTGGRFTNSAGGDILVGLTSGGQPVFRVDGTGTVTATGFVGNGSGLTNLPGVGVATDLNCAGCVSSSEVSFNYAGSSSQGGAATSALSADAATTAATATNALSLGGVAAANYARTDIGNTFNGNQTIIGVQPFLSLNTTTTFQSGIYFKASGAYKYAIFTDTGGMSQNNLSFYDQAAGATRLFINPSGNVGIGTTAPAVKLQVVGDIRVGTTGTNGCVQNYSGGALAGTCSSDARLKVNIRSFPPVLARLAQLRPVTFNWRAADYPEYHFGPARSSGLIAQDVEKVFPELVTEDARGFKQVNYSELPYLMLQGIRDLKAENDSLREQMKSQQAQMRALETELAEAKQILRLVQAQLLSGRRVVETAGGSTR